VSLGLSDLSGLSGLPGPSGLSGTPDSSRFLSRQPGSSSPPMDWAKLTTLPEMSKV